MVAQHFDLLHKGWALQRTETIGSRQPQKGQIVCRVDIRMVRMATRAADKQVPSAVSPVPLPAEATELGGLPGIFSLQANTLFLTPARQFFCKKGVQPVRRSNSRSSLATCCLEVNAAVGERF